MTNSEPPAIDPDIVDADPDPSSSSGSSRGGLLRSSALVGAGTALSRITGFVRVAAIAYAFGASNLGDAYNLANQAPNVVYELILGGILSATLVPVFIDHLKRDDGGVQAIVAVTLRVLVVLTVAAVVAAPWIMRLYTSLRDADDAAALEAVGVPLMRMFLVQILFYGLTTLATAILNARKVFTAPAFAPVLNNLVVAAVMVAVPIVNGGNPELADVNDDAGLLLLIGLGTTAGIVAMTVVLWPFVRRTGLSFPLDAPMRHPAVREVARLSGWTVGYVAANQVALAVIAVLANQREGDVTAYTTAFVFFQLPHGLVAVSIMTTFLPELSDAAASDDWVRFRSRFAYGLRALAAAILPASVGYVVIGRPLVSVLLQRGSFDAADVAVTADILQNFALGLVGFSVYLYALRGFYAMKDTKTPFVLNVFENGLNIVLAVALVGPLGVQGLALAYAGAYLTAAVVALLVLRTRIGGLGGSVTRRSLTGTAGAAVAMGVIVGAVTARVGGLSGAGALARVGLGVGLGAAVYVAILGLLGSTFSPNHRVDDPAN
ncbi:MAG TPA: murein biosynthesis integral membrane protein MurJ [Acidimicrobiales bacterium]|nr:murein biosynthesis integral membrane protein MurJ [Acidimicrobiales bacterium]